MNVLKLHYLLWFGSLAGILPFVQIFAKYYSNASSVDVGFLFTILPFLSILFKPIFCSIADHYSLHKKMLFLFLVITTLGFGLLITLPYIQFGSYSWYWYCLLVIIANVSMGIVITLTDSLVMEEVTQKNKSFGSYRLYGTIGWGAFGFLGGYINFLTRLPYLIPGLIMMLVGLSIDILSVGFKYKRADRNSQQSINVQNNGTKEKHETSFNLNTYTISQKCKQILDIFKKHPSLIQYVILVIIFGILTAFHWSFYFWFIEEIRGKDTLLFGLCILVQSFIGELPFFFISDKIVRYYGFAISLNICLLVFAARYFAYGYLLSKSDTYWDVLLIELCQGPNFGLYYTVMISLAHYYADKSCHLNRRTENIDEKIQNKAIHATMQGIMSGCYEGLGIGIGSLIGGILIEKLGVFKFWRCASFFAFGSLICNIIIDVVKYILTNKKHKQPKDLTIQIEFNSVT